ncbi:hypothetical protein MKOR_14350 [Mycolicibacillus koreensis]|nr:hypothetical protein MKOR_14350 [Mycolicibacillus koreensis]
MSDHIDTATASQTDPPANPPDTPALTVPEGFFDEVSAVLRSESAADVSDAVIEVCTQRGILHPELEQEPDSELRSDEIREVFELVEATSYAVADGRVMPADRREEQFDEQMLGLWEQFIDDATDEESEQAAAQLASGGTL